MPRPLPTHVYHMTRIEHLPSIIKHGLLSDTRAQDERLIQSEIGDHGIKAARRVRRVPCGLGGCVADYVPFYFAPRSPMLFSITRGNVSDVDSDTGQIIYLCSSTQVLQQAGLTLVYSNMNARMALARLTTDERALDGDDFIDWPLMRETYWSNTEEDPNRKERRQAECLAAPRVEWRLINSVAAKTQAVADQAANILRGAGLTTEVSVRPNWYF